MEKRIRIRLEIWKTSLVMQVLEMDESFRVKKSYSAPHEYYATVGIRVTSMCRPEIYETTKIYLRGYDRKDDLKVVVCQCGNAKEARDLKNKILLALEEWSKNWFNPPDVKSSAIPNDENIYEF